MKPLELKGCSSYFQEEQNILFGWGGHIGVEESAKLRPRSSYGLLEID